MLGELMCGKYPISLTYLLVPPLGLLHPPLLHHTTQLHKPHTVAETGSPRLQGRCRQKQNKTFVLYSAVHKILPRLISLSRARKSLGTMLAYYTVDYSVGHSAMLQPLSPRTSLYHCSCLA